MMYHGAYILDAFSYTPPGAIIEAATVEEAAQKLKEFFPPLAGRDLSDIKKKWIVLTFEKDGHFRGERLDYDTCTVI